MNVLPSFALFMSKLIGFGPSIQPFLRLENLLRRLGCTYKSSATELNASSIQDSADAAGHVLALPEYQGRTPKS